MPSGTDKSARVATWMPCGKVDDVAISDSSKIKMVLSLDQKVKLR